MDVCIRCSTSTSTVLGNRCSCGCDLHVPRLRIRVQVRVPVFALYIRFDSIRCVHAHANIIVVMPVIGAAASGVVWLLLLLRLFLPTSVAPVAGFDGPVTGFGVGFDVAPVAGFGFGVGFNCNVPVAGF